MTQPAPAFDAAVACVSAILGPPDATERLALSLADTWATVALWSRDEGASLSVRAYDDTPGVVLVAEPLGDVGRSWPAVDAADLAAAVREAAAWLGWALPRPSLRVRLGELALLADGWNGYGAPAPSVVALERMQDVLAAAEAAGFVPSRLAADADGGVFAYWFGAETLPGGSHRRVASMLVDNDGCAAAHTQDRLAGDAGFAFDVRLPDLVGETLARLREFVEARPTLPGLAPLDVDGAPRSTTNGALGEDDW